MDLTALAPLPLSPQLNVKIESNADLDNLSSTYSPVSTSSHNLNNTSFNNVSCDGDPTNGTPGLDYKNLFQYQQHMSTNSNKIRKRSANQAYEYLTSLPDSKTFQEWLVSNETDFTWVHKRNSMTNAGKKYYYICNYRIKKGFLRCPAVIYALFPNNEDSTVMVYSCGDHDHRRIDQMKTPENCGLLSRNSLLSFFSQQSNQQLKDEVMDNDDDNNNDDYNEPTPPQPQSAKRQKTYHNSNSNDLLSTSSPSSSPLSSVSASTSPVLQQQQQQHVQTSTPNHANGIRNTVKDHKRSISSLIDAIGPNTKTDEITIESIMSKMNYEAFAAVAAAAAAQSPLNNTTSNNPTSQLNNIINGIQ
jgi:hypothetical protein